MFCIKYKTWKDICEMYFSLKSGSQKSYLQWFPLTRLTASDKEALCSEDFYNKYIKNFSYILFQNNLHQSNNFLQKSDGSFRTSSLVSPLLYLVLQAVGKEIFEIYVQTRSSDLSIYYAGNYGALRPNYKQDYDAFFKEINSNIDDFEYFIKTDITNFYSSININKLIARIVNNIISGTTIFLSETIKRNGGNYDDKLIKNLCDKHGIRYTAADDNGDLKKVKTCRNQLAHGIDSFSNYARDITIDDLKHILDGVINFISAILIGMETYYNDKSFLAT